MTDRLTAWLLVLAAASSGPAAAAETPPTPFIYEAPLEMAGDELPSADLALQVTLHTREPAALEQLLASTSVRIDAVSKESLRVTLHGRDRVTTPATGRHLTPSFLIDYDQQPVRDLLADLDTNLEGTARIHVLSELVHKLMRPTSYGRGFDTASIVASNLVGDCSEHAVLLTALGRSLGMPARTVIGSVILTAAGRAGSYGHAWTEIYLDGEWHLADATVSTSNDSPIRHYLPVGTVDDEGMGYQLDLFRVINAMPSRLSAARPVERNNAGQDAK